MLSETQAPDRAEAALPSCPCCGSRDLRSRAVLWDALADGWGLSAEERRYIDRQQGLQCGDCRNNLRSMSLAKAIMDCYGYAGLFRRFVRTWAYRSRSVLEVNEPGNLGYFLAKRIRYTRAAYPAVDMMALPYGDRRFDLVVHSDTLEHVADPVAGLRECRRVLRPGGFCCFTVPVIVGRLTTATHGKPPTYHGTHREDKADYLVHTEYGADAWAQLFEAGFSACRIVATEFPASVALVGVR